MSDRRQAISLAHIPSWKKHILNVIIETPRGSRNKYKFDERLGIFTVHRVLPAGSAFPYDFGFLSGTLAEDGDPIDVLVLMDEPAMPGCVVQARIAGIMKASQKEKRRPKERNDRIIAVAIEAHDYSDIHHIKDINKHLLRELEEFFVDYHRANNSDFVVKGYRGPREARRAIEKSISAYRKDRDK